MTIEPGLPVRRRTPTTARRYCWRERRPRSSRRLPRLSRAENVEEPTREIADDPQRDEKDRERDRGRDRYADGAEQPSERALAGAEAAHRDWQQHDEQHDRDEDEVHRQPDVDPDRPAQTPCLDDADDLNANREARAR